LIRCWTSVEHMWDFAVRAPVESANHGWRWPDSSPPRIRYEERALFPRHSFAEMKRMHGQKPLRSPGAWQEYLSAAWLPARCPHVHTSRASSGEAPAGRPRTPISGFASCKFLLVTVPRSLCTLAPFSRPGDFVPLSFASAQANVQAPSPCGRLRFPALLLRGKNLSASLRLCCWNYNPVQPSEPSGRIRWDEAAS